MCTCNWVSYAVNNTLIYSYYDIIILLIKGNIPQILFFVLVFAISSLSFKLFIDPSKILKICAWLRSFDIMKSKLCDLTNLRSRHNGVVTL